MEKSEIEAAIQNGTLGYWDCMNEFNRRRDLLEFDTTLPPDVRVRGLKIFDQAIGFGVLDAICENRPVVTVLQATIKTIAELYAENAASAQQQQGMDGTSDAVDNETDLTSEQAPIQEASSEPAEPLLEFDESSNKLDELGKEPASDYASLSRLQNNAVGKRKPGRPKRRHLEKERVAAAVLARRNRKRASYRSLQYTGRDPKRHLYGPPDVSSPKSLSPSSLSSASLHTEDFMEDSNSNSDGSEWEVVDQEEESLDVASVSSKQPVNDDVAKNDTADSKGPKNLISKLNITSETTPENDTTTVSKEPKNSPLRKRPTPSHRIPPSRVTKSTNAIDKSGTARVPEISRHFKRVTPAELAASMTKFRLERGAKGPLPSEMPSQSGTISAADRYHKALGWEFVSQEEGREIGQARQDSISVTGSGGGACGVLGTPTPAPPPPPPGLKWTPTSTLEQPPRRGPGRPRKIKPAQETPAPTPSPAPAPTTLAPASSGQQPTTPTSSFPPLSPTSPTAQPWP